MKPLCECFLNHEDAVGRVDLVVIKAYIPLNQ